MASGEKDITTGAGQVTDHSLYVCVCALLKATERFHYGLYVLHTEQMYTICNAGNDSKVRNACLTTSFKIVHFL